MSIKEAYNIWASQYDTNKNNTRDLEAIALRNKLEHVSFKTCLEIGCGTGKNTVWLEEKSEEVLSVDLSDEMLQIAKQKITSPKVRFVQADITKDWSFSNKLYDLITFSLVLEHIEDLDQIFKEVARCLKKGGFVYIGELHPFKQYTGTKARFDTEEGRYEVECYDHHISDFVNDAKKNGLTLIDIDEHFDDNNRNSIPRILTLLLKK